MRIRKLHEAVEETVNPMIAAAMDLETEAIDAIHAAALGNMDAHEALNIIEEYANALEEGNNQDPEFYSEFDEAEEAAGRHAGYGYYIEALSPIVEQLAAGQINKTAAGIIYTLARAFFANAGGVTAENHETVMWAVSNSLDMVPAEYLAGDIKSINRF